jgi:7-keto-8-aminopelargonate synthetase-like enzyme
MLVVDEAHGIGVFGKGGGVCRELGIRPDMITGTLSKALGGYGGFAACSGELREYLVNSSRSFIYSTGLPPGSVGGALAALDILSENRNMGKELLKRARTFRRGLAGMGLSPCESSTQIVPLETGDPSAALEFSAGLDKKGILAVAVRPPTVPVGTSRLRFSVTLAHSPGQIGDTLETVRSILR